MVLLQIVSAHCGNERGVRNLSALIAARPVFIANAIVFIADATVVVANLTGAFENATDGIAAKTGVAKQNTLKPIICLRGLQTRQRGLQGKQGGMSTGLSGLQ